jgi:GTP-binding protein HflX
VLVHLRLPARDDQEDLEELGSLARSAGLEPVAEVVGTRDAPDPHYFVGSGKAQEVKEAVEASGAGVVLVNHALSPAQERNLERFLGARTVDRTGLILDIFAQRARSFEGQLQVELAQLRHLSTRLVRGWTHLERQRGGIGLRGPGEKQLETDRRLVARRIQQIGRQLERLQRQRSQQRRRRRRADLPTVSLVGYTNAGKSTLFNRLTGAGVVVADQLFATLDPTLRRLELPGGGPVVLADTVGFIRHLPHDLVAAFRSTLEETREASLLLHVVDASDPERDARVAQVNGVLEEIGAGAVPQVEVYNKIDLAPGREPGAETGEDGRVRRVWVSAATGAGLEALREAIAGCVHPGPVLRRLHLPPGAGRLRARLFAAGAVRREEVLDAGWLLEVRMAPDELEALCRREGLPAEAVAGGA